MATHGEFIERCVRRVHNKNVRTEVSLREITIDNLAELSSLSVLFMERSFEFDLVAEQSEYEPGHAGYPAGAVEFNAVHLRFDQSDLEASTIELGLVPLATARLKLAEMDFSGWPDCYALRGRPEGGRTMIVAPRPGTDQALAGECRIGAQLDEITGVKITEDLDAATNPWYSEGIGVLQSGVLRDYFATVAGDEPQASLYHMRWARLVESYENAFHARTPVFQARAHG